MGSVCPGNGPCWCLLQEAPRTSNNAFEGSALIKACGKLELLSKMLRHIYGSEHRVLIFSQVGWVWGWSYGTAQQDTSHFYISFDYGFNYICILNILSQGSVL